MKARATIYVTELLLFCDEITGIEFEVVAAEFKGADNSAVYCDSPESVLALLRELKQRNALAQAAGAVVPGSGVSNQ